MDDVGQTLLNWASAFGTQEMVRFVSLPMFIHFQHGLSYFFIKKTVSLKKANDVTQIKQLISLQALVLNVKHMN